MKRLVYAFLFLPIVLQAQGIKISSSPGAPDPSAGLEIDFNNKGVLLPRMTTAQRNAIVNPAVGLQIYNTTIHCVQVYFPGGWNNAGCDCTQPPSPPTSISLPLHVCAGDTGILISTPSVQGASSYSWVLPFGWVLTSGLGSNSIVVQAGQSIGSVSISVSASNGCGSSSAIQSSISVESSGAQFSFPNSIFISQPVTFTPSLSSGTHAWSFQSGSPSSSTLITPSVTWSSGGSFAVQHIRSVGNCVDTVVQTVVVTPCTYQAGSQTFNNTSTGPSGTIQTFTVPPCVSSITIDCRGARGGGNGGNGARMIGTFAVNSGDQLSILVGQRGLDGPNSTGNGGGGGSFVVAANNTLLIAAGGGGGTGHNNANGTYADIHGKTGTAGGVGQSTGGAGGTNGNGGGWASCGSCGSNGNAAGGGGFLTNGGTQAPVFGGAAYLNGGAGGNSTGGYGGGGGGTPVTYSCSSGNMGGSGGGGYSGGGGGASNCNAAGGGGGSFNSGTNQSNSAGFQTGHGQVVISW